MPRRTKGEAEKTDETEETPDADAPANREPGPTTTRTGAQALTIETDSGTRTFTAGGEKGQHIAELLKSKPDMTRKEIAEVVGCSQSRVAEVARVLGLTKPRSEAKPEPEAANA